MTPKEVLKKWIELFNNADAEKISELYSENAINHQVANEPIIGKKAIKEMFVREFGNAEMVCAPENIFEDGDWAIWNGKIRKNYVVVDFSKYKMTK